jgi:hypothetical protein
MSSSGSTTGGSVVTRLTTRSGRTVPSIPNLSQWHCHYLTLPGGPDGSDYADPGTLGFIQWTAPVSLSIEQGSVKPQCTMSLIRGGWGSQLNRRGVRLSIAAVDSESDELIPGTVFPSEHDLEDLNPGPRTLGFEYSIHGPRDGNGTAFEKSKAEIADELKTWMNRVEDPRSRYRQHVEEALRSFRDEQSRRQALPVNDEARALEPIANQASSPPPQRVPEVAARGDAPEHGREWDPAEDGSDADTVYEADI